MREDRTTRKRLEFQVATDSSPRKTAPSSSLVQHTSQAGSSPSTPSAQGAQQGRDTRSEVSSGGTASSSGGLQGPLSHSREGQHQAQRETGPEEGKEYFTCSLCDAKFTFQNNLDRHTNHAHKEKQYSCPECPEKFSRKDSLERHIRGGKHSFVNECRFCKQRLVFKSESAMYKHYVKDPPRTGKDTCINQIKKKGISAPSTSQPPISDVTSAGSARSLRRATSPSGSPQRRTTQPRPSETCQVCEMKFASKQVLNRHMHEQHSNPEKFPCPICPQLFTRKESLDMHVARGKHTFSITCKYCNQDIEFKSDAEMHRHFTMEPDWAMASWPRAKTCVNVLKWKEHNPVYNSYTCDHCLERIPNSGAAKHGILDPTKSLSGHRDPKYDTLDNQMTCVNVLKKRDIITCSECKETFKFANLRDHYPPDTPFDLINRENISLAISPCKVLKKEIELMRAGKWEEYSKVRAQRKS